MYTTLLNCNFNSYWRLRISCCWDVIILYILLVGLSIHLFIVPIVLVVYIFACSIRHADCLLSVCLIMLVTWCLFLSGCVCNFLGMWIFSCIWLVVSDKVLHDILLSSRETNSWYLELLSSILWACHYIHICLAFFSPDALPEYSWALIVMILLLLLFWTIVSVHSLSRCCYFVVFLVAWSFTVLLWILCWLDVEWYIELWMDVWFRFMTSLLVQ